MSSPSSSPEREGGITASVQLENLCSPAGPETDPLSVGSPVLSPDSSSHDAALSAPAVSPADSENLSPDELELLAKLEEQNRYVATHTCILDLFHCKAHRVYYGFHFILLHAYTILYANVTQI